MSTLLGLLSWLLLIAMWVWVLSILVRPGATRLAAPQPAPPKPSPPRPAASRSTPPRSAPPPRSGDARPVSPDSAAGPEPLPVVPVRPPAPRRDVLLLGAGPDDLDVADAAARRHLHWVGQQRQLPTPDSPSADSGNAAVALGAARAAVLGSRSPGDVDAALRDCATVGVPLLLPART